MKIIRFAPWILLALLVFSFIPLSIALAGPQAGNVLAVATATATKIAPKILAFTPTKTPTKVPTLAVLATKPPTKVPTLAAIATKTPTKVPTLAAIATKTPTRVPTLAAIATKPPTKVPTLAVLATKTPTQASPLINTPTRTPAPAITAAPSQTPVPTRTDVPTPGPGSFTLDQTLSDGAQQMTMAFDGLAFVTGNLGSDSFFPPGKVADFWGFQYLRDNDPSGMGHNTDFLTKASLNTLLVLTSDQKAQLIALARSQVNSINEYGYKRFVLMTAFRRLLENNLPAGTTALNQDAVKAYSASLYRLDGQISYQRAQVMGNILNNLDATQKAYLDSMVGKGMTSWPTVAEPDELRGLTQDEKVAVMTYAGDMFSWYAGTVEADVYFCPERQGTYFGSFYMKDAPAVGNPGYSIGTNITADYGAAFLRTLSSEQAATITSLTQAQKASLYEIVDRRRDVSTLLRQFRSGTTPDQATVLSLMERYGELDGQIIYQYASTFAQINQGLNSSQKTQLLAMRTALLGNLSYPSGAYLYAQSIAMPEVPNTDFLFK